MKRLEKFREKLKEMGIDGAIILNELNQYYLSGFAFTDGLLLITHNSAHLITDFRYFEMAENRADKGYKVVMPENKNEYIAKIIAEDSVKSLGFEGDFVPYNVYYYYKEKYPSVEFVNIGDTIEKQRQLKDADEIAIIQKAQDITDAAFSHLLSVIKTNMTEIEVAAELEYYMRKFGADDPGFDTIAVSGDASALPHGTPRNVKLKKGFLTLDFGAKYKGYTADMTRTLVIGKADEKIKKLYNTVLKAQLAALDFLKEGQDCGEADKVARDIIDAEKEYFGTFGHSLGHSIGLQVHEAPGLSKRYFGYKMRAGELYSVEPGIYLYGKYGCRIEDLVAIEKDGVHNFTHSTKELIEIY